jgi:hypothetical protein
MYVYLTSVSERTKPRHTVQAHFDGASRCVTFEYGVAFTKNQRTKVVRP